MERALLQGEKEAERALMQKEQKAADQLQEKLVTLETGIQKERDKVTNNWPGSVLGPVTSERRRNALSGAPYLYLIIHPADWVVSVPLQGQGPCLLWKVPAWRAVQAGLMSGVSSVWVSATSGCLVACHSGPFMAVLGSTKALLGQ